VYENFFARAMVEPGWQRRLVSALCRWNLNLLVRDRELRRRLTPEPARHRDLLRARDVADFDVRS